MAKLTLAEMRAKLLAAEEKKENGGGFTPDKTLFPHWSIPLDTTATLRFLSDGNESNEFFWRERRLIKIPFSGVKGGDQNKAITVTVPSLTTWGERCPIVEEIRPWWKNEAMKPYASKYNAKKSYLMQGFVVSSELDEEAPENLIRRFIVNSLLFPKITAIMMDPDLMELPTDMNGGTDFRISKTQSGQWPSYDGTWARKERSLSEAERNAIETHGLKDLNDYMPTKPTEAEVAAQLAMFEASYDGDLYDPDKFAEFYRPWGMEKPGSSNSSNSDNSPKSSSKSSSTVDEDVAAIEKKAAAKAETKAETKAATPKSGMSATDILASIKARKTD
jgi:hypothetical protein